MEDSERRKAIELLKEMRSENKTVDGKSSSQETHLNWMYKGPSDLIDREEYLLGKAIDKNFEVLNSGGSSDIGRTGEQSNVPKRLLEKTDSLEQVDVAKKILEDPLYAIKQKEMEARKKLLNNPVKLKQIKQMLLERSKQNSSHTLKKKKLKQKSEQDLDFLILKKLEKFTDREKRKALNKILKSGFDSNSTENSSSNKRKNKKLKLKRKRSHSSSDEYDSSSQSSSSSSSSNSSSTSSSSSESFTKKKRKKYKINKKKQSRRNEESSSSSSSSECEKNEKSKNKTLNRKHFRKSFNLDSESSKIYEKVKKSPDRSLRNYKSSRVNNKYPDLREEYTGKRERKKHSERERNKDKKNSFSDEESKFKKTYGLMVPDGSEPHQKRKREFHIPKDQKSVESKKKYVPPPKVKPLSDKEKEEKLKEMMENAKLRKEDREKNLANHLKKQALEEESKTYDNDFIRRQMSHLTSRGTMADRIKSNINNIQRSKSSMDTNFMRK